MRTAQLKLRSMAIHLTEANRRKHSRHEKMKGFLEKKMLSLKKKKRVPCHSTATKMSLCQNQIIVAVPNLGSSIVEGLILILNSVSFFANILNSVLSV